MRGQICFSAAAKRRPRELCYASGNDTKLPSQFRGTRSFDARWPLKRIPVVRAEGCGIKCASLGPRSRSIARGIVHAQLHGVGLRGNILIYTVGAMKNFRGELSCR